MQTPRTTTEASTKDRNTPRERHAPIAKESTHYANPGMQKDVQETLDEAPVQAILNTPIHYGRQGIDQEINWRTY